MLKPDKLKTRTGESSGTTSVNINTPTGARAQRDLSAAQSKSAHVNASNIYTQPDIAQGAPDICMYRYINTYICTYFTYTDTYLYIHMYVSIIYIHVYIGCTCI